MKRVILMVAIFLGTLGFATSQTFNLGIKGGYLYSNMDGVKDWDSFSSKGKSGYLVGVFARIGGEKFFFQPELQYRARTTQLTTKKDIALNTVDIDMKTLDLPLQVGLNLLDLSLVKIAIHAGPVISYNLSNDTKWNTAISSIDLKNVEYKDFITSGQIGISADVSSFTIDLSYEKGFSDISKDKLGKNDLFMVTVGFKIF